MAQEVGKEQLSGGEDGKKEQSSDEGLVEVRRSEQGRGECCTAMAGVRGLAMGHSILSL